MPVPKIPSEDKIREAATRLRQMSSEISQIYLGLGGPALWRAAHAAAHDSDQSRLNNDEHEAVFDLVRAMETLVKSNEETSGAVVFLESLLHKPHLREVLWGRTRRVLRRSR